MGKPNKRKKQWKPASNPASEELHAAARSGDLHAVHRILSSNPLALNSRDKHSRTPLHLAAWSGHKDIVDFLCKKADVGAAAMDDMGAIHFAAQKGHVDVIQILLASGVSVKSTNRKGMTALHYAVQGSHVELVKYLMKKGANADAKNNVGKTPSDLASNEEVRSALVECQTTSSGKKVPSNKEKSAETQSNSGAEAIVVTTNKEVNHGDEDSENKDSESMKRKTDGGDVAETLPEAKKPRVALGHLLAADDTNEE